MSDTIQKAKHNVGDHHPTQPWVWTEYKPGKFNWRVDKNAHSKPSADTGKQSSESSADTRLEAWAKKTSDDNLLKVVNNPKGNAQLRQIAYNELKSRNVDLSQVDTSGTLATLLKMTVKQDPVAPTGAKAQVDIDEARVVTTTVKSSRIGSLTLKTRVFRRSSTNFRAVKTASPTTVLSTR